MTRDDLFAASIFLAMLVSGATATHTPGSTGGQVCTIVLAAGMLALVSPLCRRAGSVAAVIVAIGLMVQPNHGAASEASPYGKATRASSGSKAGDPSGDTLQADGGFAIQANLQPARIASTRGAVKRVIVGFGASDAVLKARPSPTVLSRRQREIAAAQERIGARLPVGHFARLRHYRNLPFLAVTVDELALDTLRADPEVTQISEDVRFLASLAQSVPLVGADNVWDAGFEGGGRAVAILDTGVDKSHPFLANKVVMEACFSTSDPGQQATSLCPNGLDQEIGAGAALPCSIASCDHGTHVAGIAAGYSRHYPGVAPAAELIAVQVFSRFDDRGAATPCADAGASSPCLLAKNTDIIAALDWLYSLGMTGASRINIAAVNLSLGGGRYTSSDACDQQLPATKAAIDQLVGLAVATVISAGNEGYDDGIGQPACISSAISVGATTKSDEIALYPGGADWASNSAAFLSMLAPGVGISSSVTGGDYAAKDGTSMAAPHVTGGIALLSEFKPGLSVSDLLDVLQEHGKPIKDPRNGHTTARLELSSVLVEHFTGDGYDDIVFIKGGPVDASDYRLAVVAGPTPASPGGVTLAGQDEVADDYWLHYWSPGRTLGVTTLNDLDNDGNAEIAYLKGGKDGPADYRLIVVSGPSAGDPGGDGLFSQEEAPDDYWLQHWSTGRTVGVVAINDLDGDGYQDIAYLKGGENGHADYRLVVVSGPDGVSAGGEGIHVQESAPDDYWLDHWVPGRTVGVTAINDIDGDGYQEIAYLKGGPDGASDYRLIVVSGPSASAPGGSGLVTQEVVCDDYWLAHWGSGRTVGVTAINDISGDGFDDIAYLKGGPGGPTDYRLIFVTGPSSPSSPGGSVIATQEYAPDDNWLEHWSPGQRTVQIARLRFQ